MFIRFNSQRNLWKTAETQETSSIEIPTKSAYNEGIRYYDKAQSFCMGEIGCIKEQF